MISLKLLNFKSLLSQCLLAGILFISFIAIAGHGGYSNSIFSQTRQTELIYLRRNPDANKTFLFRKASLQKNPTNFYSQHSNLISLLIYSRLTKIKLYSLSKKRYSIPIPKRLYLVNNIPQDSGKESFSSFTS
jgi:hypothetical protein